MSNTPNLPHFSSYQSHIVHTAALQSSSEMNLTLNDMLNPYSSLTKLIMYILISSIITHIYLITYTNDLLNSYSSLTTLILYTRLVKLLYFTHWYLTPLILYIVYLTQIFSKIICLIYTNDFLRPSMYQSGIYSLDFLYGFLTLSLPFHI